MKIIGSKSKFAIEYKIIDKTNFTGYSRIWFGDEYIGSKKELIYFKSYLFNGLKSIGNSEKLDFHLKKDNITEKYAFLEKRLSDSVDDTMQSFLVSFGTLSDDYLIFSYLDDNNICIIWKLIQNSGIFEDIDYSDENIKFFKIQKEDFLKELKRIEETILTT